MYIGRSYLIAEAVQAIQADIYVSPSSGTIVSGQSFFFDSHLPPLRTIDLGGNILSPGFIDVQLNGAYGVDFSELNLEDVDGGEERYVKGLEKVAGKIVETGCTSFVPTIITQKEELYQKVRLNRPEFMTGGVFACSELYLRTKLISAIVAITSTSTPLTFPLRSYPRLPRRRALSSSLTARRPFPDPPHDCCAFRNIFEPDRNSRKRVW